MSVTVVVRRRAQPGKGELLVAAALQRIETPSLRARPNGTARVFQGLADPDLVLYVADWDSREAYWARRREVGRIEEFEALCVGQAKRHFFQRLAFYECMERRAVVACNAILECPAATSGAVLTFFEQEVLPAVRTCSGFVLHTLSQDVDNPHRFLVLAAWESPTARDAAYRDLAPQLDAQLHAYGVTIEHFAGRTRAEIDRYARPTSEPPECRTSPSMQEVGRAGLAAASSAANRVQRGGI